MANQNEIVGAECKKFEIIDQPKRRVALLRCTPFGMRHYSTAFVFPLECGAIPPLLFF
jgi:hypothetical protein